MVIMFGVGLDIKEIVVIFVLKFFLINCVFFVCRKNGIRWYMILVFRFSWKFYCLNGRLNGKFGGEEIINVYEKCLFRVVVSKWLLMFIVIILLIWVG